MNSNNKKPKKNKRRCNYEKTTHTLDVCHEKQLDKFNKEYNTINKLKKDLKSKEKKIANIEKNKSNNNTSDEISNNLNTLFELNKNKKSIQDKIILLESKKDELEYLTETSDILFNYYDTIKSNNENSSNVKQIIDFFNMDNIEDSQQSKRKNSLDDNQNRSQLLENYLSTTDKNYINNNLKQVEDKCRHCNSENINELLNDGILFCNDCNTIEFILTDNERPSYRDPPKEISYFSYNRINHFDIGVKQEALKVCIFLVLIY